MVAETLDEIEMACHVLAEMAKRGSVEAASVLTDEVREGAGWSWAIQVLADADHVLANAPELSHRGLIVDDGLLGQLSDRVKTSEWTGEPPWGALNAYPQLRWLAPDVDFTARAPKGERPDVANWSVEDLRAAALGATHTPEALAAAHTLGARGDLDVFDAFVAKLEADPGTPVAKFQKRAGDYLVALPAERSLPLARRWLNERFPLSLIAERIFEARARPADRVVIEQAVLAALAGGNYYRVQGLSGALRRLADQRSASAMRTVFEQSPYALARQETLGGLIAIGNADAEDLIVEALWDCYGGCRYLACAHAPLSDRTRTRLQEIQNDPFEEETNRKTAATRLT